MAAAFEAAKSFFKKDPDILFVILPERGARFPTAEPPPCTVAKEYCWDPEADRLADASRLPHDILQGEMSGCFPDLFLR